MSGPRSTTWRPTPRTAVLGATVASLVLVLPGCTGGDDKDPGSSSGSARAAEATTALVDVDAGGLAVTRASFCDAVADADVEDALGGPAESAHAWQSGDKVAVTGGSDVAHEYGCAWRGADPAVAQAWVFAPPVTADRARAVVRAEQRRPGCRALPGAAPFSTPSAALLCRSRDDGGALVASYRGLFGDAWLTCAVSADVDTDEADLAARADRWCAAVLGAATG